MTQINLSPQLGKGGEKNEGEEENEQENLEEEKSNGKWKVKVPKRATGGQRGRIQRQAAAEDGTKGRGRPMRQRRREPARMV